MSCYKFFYQSNVCKKEKDDGKVILEHGFSVSGKNRKFDLSIEIFVVFVSAVDVVSGAGSGSCGRVSSLESGKKLDLKIS